MVEGVQQGPVLVETFFNILPGQGHVVFSFSGPITPHIFRCSVR